MGNSIVKIAYFSAWEEGLVETTASLNLQTGSVTEIEVSDEGSEYESLIREYIKPFNSEICADVEPTPDGEYGVMSLDDLASLNVHFEQMASSNDFIHALENPPAPGPKLNALARRVPVWRDGTKEPAERTDLYLPRNSFEVGTTYIGSKNDIRHLIGIGQEFAPHNATTDKTWVAYELLSPELKNLTGQRRGFSERGLPIYHCSLTAFRFWARKVVVIAERSSAIQ